VNRYDWLRAVLQSEVGAPAKAVASALAVQFANDETGQVNPSQETLADYLKVHRDTIKRAVRELRNAGWLFASEGRGSGNRTFYRLLSPGKVVPFAVPRKGAEVPPEKGANLPLHAEEKGANLPRKGCKSAPSNKEEQAFEQEGRASDPRRCPVERLAEVKPGSHREAEWNAWLTARGWPTVADLGMRLNGGWAMPYTMPPSDQYGIEERATERFVNWATARMIERREASA
jgi:biotin operon repressor